MVHWSGEEVRAGIVKTEDGLTSPVSFTHPKVNLYMNIQQCFLTIILLNETWVVPYFELF